MVTNGDPSMDHELFHDVQNTQDITPPFESSNNIIPSLDNLTRKNKLV